MYKLASRNLQRRHAVDKPLPTGGYIGSAQVEDDFIPSADNMSIEECRAEQRQLKLELTKAQNALLVAKANHDKAEIATLGLRLSTYGMRLSLISARLKVLVNPAETQVFSDATREIVSPEQWGRIIARVRVLREERGLTT